MNEEFWRQGYLTDGQTDGRTDRLITNISELLSKSGDKNSTKHCIIKYSADYSLITILHLKCKGPRT